LEQRGEHGYVGERVIMITVKNSFLLTGGMVLGLLATGCATKKYVAKSIAPVEARVTADEAKNGEQDKTLGGQAKQIEELDRDLSRTKEHLSDTDKQVASAALAAKNAGDRADAANRSADGARSLAEQGLDRTKQLGRNVERTLDAMNNFQMKKSTTVLFGFNQSGLNDEAKAQLDDFAKQIAGMDRFIIEVQGFTDKIGSPVTNEAISQARAAAVTRYLVNDHKVPVRAISAVGSGYALPVGDDKTSEGRKENRRVEVRLFVPEATNAQALTAQQ
jgi:outer membrane protein OmpA-like peptidoglycan-associated protein